MTKDKKKHKICTKSGSLVELGQNVALNKGLELLIISIIHGSTLNGGLTYGITYKNCYVITTNFLGSWTRDTNLINGPKFS